MGLWKSFVNAFEEGMKEAKRQAEAKKRAKEGYTDSNEDVVQERKNPVVLEKYKHNLSGPNIVHTYSKVVGVTVGNRQKLVKQLVEGEYLQVVREKNNPHDSNAIALYIDEGQIGYIRKEFAETLAPIIDSGGLINVQVKEVTGKQYSNTGVNIAVEYRDKGINRRRKNKKYEFVEVDEDDDYI